MNFNKLTNWLSTHVPVKYRLRLVCLWYLLFLMISTRKHSLQEAARFSGINTSQFSKFLKNHSELAILSLHDLSKKQAKQFSNVMNYLANNTLPWKIAILMAMFALSVETDPKQHSIKIQQKSLGVAL